MELAIKKYLNDIVIAILICMNPICWVLPVSSGAILITSIFALALYLLGNNNLLRPNIIGLVLFNLLFFMPLAFGTTDNHILKYLFEFLAVGIVSLYVSQSSFNKDNVFKFTCLISVLLFPLIFKMNLKFADPGSLMGYSYGYLKMIIPILYTILFIDMKKIFKCTLVLPLLLYFAKFIVFASRGAVLALLVFIAFLIYIKYIKNYKLGIVAIFTLSIAVIVCFEPIVLFIQKTLESFGVDIYAFEKMLRMLKHGDVTNGRESIAKVALSMGLESTIWGHGVAAFEARYHTGYVHNIFLQLFVEGGILLLLPYCYYIYKTVMFIANPNNLREDRIFMSVLFAMGFIELLFSNYLWRSQVFWLLIGCTMSLSKENQNNEYIWKS